MFKHIIPFLLILTIAHGYTFQSYIQQFQKSYTNEQQYNYRKGIFSENYRAILQWNSFPNTEYKQKATVWTDHTLAEVQTSKASQVGLEVVVPEGPGKVSAGLSEKRVGGLPNEIDWRSLGKVTEVKEEGACGGSWAFASTAAAESYVAVYGGDLTDLSEEYVLQCVNGGSCAGGSVAAALRLIANGGVPAESAYPYQAGNSGSISPKINGICVAGNKLTLPPGTTSTSSSNLTSTQLKSLISSSPIITLLDSTSDSGFLNYASGVYSCSSSPFTLNHAVELIGYDSSGNYLVKNSWGKTWGDNGFAVISQENNCGIGQKVYYFTGANEALKNVSYTFKLGNLTIEIYAGRMMVAVAGIMVTALTMMW